MRFSRNLPLAAAVTAVVLLPACDDGTVAPDPSLGVFGRDDGTVTVPMKIDGTMTWTVPGATPADCPDLIDPATGELFIAEGAGQGEGTRMGRFEITKLDHPTINLCGIFPPNPPLPTDDDTARSGEFEFVAADGSALIGTYTFFLPPSGREDEAFFTLVVEDGTGRFQGATGTLEVDLDRSGSAACVDPLCLVHAILEPAVFEGTLTLPKP